MKGKQKAAKRTLAALVCVLLLSALLPGAAHAAEAKPLTVGYIDYKGFVERGADGSYTGYGAEYLDRIAEYTGWEYQYVEMDWPTALEAVKAGRVDFYCVARQTLERQADYDFSLFPLCNEELNLYVLPDSQVYFEDYAAFDGLRVGVLEASVDTGYFREYARDHGFGFSLKEYPTNSLVVEALETGEVDLIAIVGYAVDGGFKFVGSFGVSPAYLMSCQDSPYMREFSAAQERLFIDDPSYPQVLELTHYGQDRRQSDLMLTRQEADFIKSSPPLTVAVSMDMAPIECYDGETGSFKGVTVDLYERIAEMTGLEFRFVQRRDAPELIGQMERGEVQLVGTLAQSEPVATALHLTQTQAFSDNSLTLVTKKIEALTQGSVVAVPAGYPKFANAAKQNGYSQLKEYGSFEECVDAVYTGKAQLTYVITMCEGYLLDHARYSELRAYPCTDAGYGMCFGVYKDYDPCLISIVNKCISAIPDKDVNELIVTNTAHAKPQQTWNDVLVKNGTLLFSLGIVLILLMAFAVLRAQRARQQ